MRYQVSTPLPLRVALQQAFVALGPSGVGLQLKALTPLGFVLQGKGGAMIVTAEPGATTTLAFQTHAENEAVEQFIIRVQERRLQWLRWVTVQAPQHLATGIVHCVRALLGRS
jgi:hypothetical protein